MAAIAYDDRGRAAVEIKVNACRTSWGWVGMAAAATGLLGTTLPVNSQQEALAKLATRWADAREGKDPVLAALEDKIRRYLDGEPVSFRGEVLAAEAGVFTREVWEIVRAIPPGQVRSYGWVAAQAGSPRGARAVGRVMATNPFPLIVPCHRVVGWNGQLTGFGGGLTMKGRLLEMERVSSMPQRSLTISP